MGITCLVVLVCVFSVFLPSVNGDGNTNGYFSFIHTSVLVEESSSRAILNIQRRVGMTGMVIVVCQILDAGASTDFVGPSVTAGFNENENATACEFGVIDDSIPEGNETFDVQLKTINSEGEVENPQMATITILANDKAYGVIGFSQSGQVKIHEPTPIASVPVNISLARLIGKYGYVSVKWEFVPGGSGSVKNFEQTSGMVSFADGQTVGVISLQAKADNISENDQFYTLRLTSVYGGAELNSSYSDLQILIPANDARVRFSVTSITVPENTTTVELVVFRGLQEDGVNKVGNIQETAIVKWYVVPGNTQPGQDFENKNGSITFNVSETRKNIQINVINDKIPELAETFSVHLETSVHNVYIGPDGVAMVTILPNDDQHGVFSFGKFPAYLDEDGANSGDFFVNRSAGSFGNVSLAWEISSTSSVDLSSVFEVTSGILVFMEGESLKAITIVVRKDSSPEEAKEYFLELSHATGGSRLGNTQGARKAVFYVNDSDSVYGVIEFANQSQQRIIQNTKPRQLSLEVDRKGGSLRSVSVNYSIEYYLPGSNSPSNELAVNPSGVVTLRNGETKKTFTVEIPSDGFLKFGSVFRIQLLDARLVGVVPLVQPKTPQLGNRSTLYLNVTTTDADGEIGFEKHHQTIQVQEPLGPSIKTVNLLVLRDGTAGRATADWAISSSNRNFNASDIGANKGMIVFEKGQNAVNLTMTIKPDDIPELDEKFVVTLSNATSRNRLQEGMESATVTILENDNPGGTFEFQNTSSFIIKEGDGFFIYVVRRGSSLDERSVGFKIIPTHDESEFIGGSGVIYFSPSERKKEKYILVNDDGIPELDENFRIVLYGYGKSPGTLGKDIAKNFTVPSNDDPYGIIEFAAQNSKRVVEKKGENATVSFVVQRAKGTFGNTDVSWVVLSDTDAKLDIYPTSGVLKFLEKQSTNSTIEILVLADVIPEKNETFTIHLESQTGRASFGSRRNATLIINKNDDPVYFAEPALIKVREGQIANLTIHRGGDGLSSITVTYSTFNGTARASDRDFVPISSEHVTFAKGEFNKTISIVIRDDDKPEGVENMTVKLISSTGDTVLQNAVATVSIYASDAGTGLFQFTASALNETINEKDGSASFTISRSIATHGVVHVYWQVFGLLDNGSLATLPSGVDFEPAVDYVIFADGQSERSLVIKPFDDSIAEMNEKFVIKIINATGIETGENGRLGNYTTAYLTVLSNDDPNGKLLFPPQSRDVKIPEDFLPGFQDTTIKNVTVKREQGDWGDIQVIWEISTSKASIKTHNTFDLMFLGDVGSGVTTSKRNQRTNTQTNVYCFDSSRSGSYGTVSSLNGLSNKELTISLWLQPAKSSFGYLLSYGIGSTVVYALAVNTTSSTSSLFFRFRDSNVTVDLGKDIANNAWHMIVVTLGFEAGTAKFYLDEQKKNDWRFVGGAVESAGTFSVGGLRPGNQNYTGCLQDIRIHAAVLEESTIKEIFKSVTAFRKLNGYLNFPAGIRNEQIEIRTVDDEIPEIDQTFSVALLAPKGGATLDENHAKAVLTVLKSDNANGLFGFASSSSITLSENSNQSIIVTRKKGKAGRVNVTWRVYKGLKGLELASHDFHPYKGSIVFGDAETEKKIFITPRDDTIPELDEHFVLKLVSSMATDGENGSTPTSGASLDPNLTMINITVTKNDFPFGLLQFMDRLPVGNDTIQPAVDAYYKDVRESSGSVKLVVVRAQGTEGTVKCSWKTEPQTAKNGIDYEDDAGDLTFAAGVRSAEITIKLKDDNIPELNKTFNVVLYNPVGGASLSSLASKAVVTILPSDDAFGVMNFTRDSTTRTVNESASVSLTVMRNGGSLGPVTVYWKASGPHQDDLKRMEGSVELVTGQRTAQIKLEIADDVSPELSESYLIQLVNVSSGRLASSGTTCNITIIANDHPYGIFQFNPNIISVTEINRNVTLVVNRTEGLLGTVRVHYTTMNSDDMLGGVRQKASVGQDFKAANGSVEFLEGQSNASFTIQILDDVFPEDEETLLVNLFGIEIIKHSPVVPVPINSPVIGRSHLAQVRILKNDNASGVLQLSASSVNVTEPYSHPLVNVTRTEGAFGEVTVYFQVTPNTAETSDYRILYTNITLQEGQRTASVPIQIVDDNLAEYDETFTIKLLSSGIQGGAVLGSPLECLVTIAINDYPYGLIGFKRGFLNITEKEPTAGSSKTVRLEIERTFGTDGTIRVYWEAFALNGDPPSNDVQPVSGIILFPPGSSQKVQELEIRPDDFPEIDEVIQIHLLNVTSGKAEINPKSRVANITILANDEPHGVIHFTKKAYDVVEDNHQKITIAHLPVKRDNGTFGDVRLYYSTIALPNSSIPGVDFKAESNASIIIPNGNSSANIPISILNDSLPELNEMFQVMLERVELVGSSPALPPRLAEPMEANVTIVSNDDANGLFVVRAIAPDPGTDGSRKTLLEGNTSVTFIVKRLGGTIGTVQVEWIISSSTNATKGRDYSGDGATWTFRPGETEKSASIKIQDDNVPETDEVIVISLINPTNGAKISSGLGNNLTIIISANDVVAGKVGFSRQAQAVVAREGANVSLLVQRSSPAAGIVTVSWTISGGNASHDFNPSSGNLTFSQHQTEANITFQVAADAKPEPNEVFIVKLTSIKTYEIADSGSAILIPDQTTATITIRASDEPHGVIEFQQGSRLVRTDEDKNVTLVVTRLYGTIGSIRVYYQIQNASTTDITAGQQLATAGVDFTGSNSSIDMIDGQSEGEILVHIIDENQPEVDEVFIVNITGVVLLSNPFNTSGIRPRLGQNRTARVVINSNDNPKGLLGFSKKRYDVNESSGAFDVIIERTQGTLGNISVIYYVENKEAIRGKDFNIPAYTGGDSVLRFYEGQREQNITIYTIDDLEPEDNKYFEITLKQVDNPLRYGYTTTQVVILHNDDARGVFSFETRENTISEPGNGEKNSAIFKVVRKTASLGTVVVGWRVLNGSASSDLTPVNGTMEFKKGIVQNTFTINSLIDSHPEKNEVFVIELYIQSDDGGRVEAPYQAILTVSENDYPYGELEITSLTSSTSTVNVEETARTVKAKVTRKKGNFGRITVDYQTVPSSAVSTAGDVVHFETIQGLKTKGAQSWYRFSAYGVDFLLLASNSSGDVSGFSGSTLYRWQGVFTKIQSIPTDGAVNWDSFSINGSTYIAVANYGEEGRTETLSSVYRLDSDYHLTLIQNISSQGASDVRFFRSNDKLYLVIANMKNNANDALLQSKVYKMQDGVFQHHSNLDTRSASGLAVFTIDRTPMLAVSRIYDKVANSYSTKSPVYEWNGNAFVLSQEITTSGPIDVEYLTQGGEHFLVFANTKGDVAVHKWVPNTFNLIQSIPTVEVKSAKFYSFGGKARLSILDGNGELKIYSWDSAVAQFNLQMNTTLSGAESVQPVVIKDPFAGQVQMLITALSGLAVSPVLVPVHLSPRADFIPRKGQLTFENGETELELDFSILKDSTPEKDETFSIMLSNATGKAVIGSNKQLTVTILSNDNAHGRLGFSDDSLIKVQPELKQDTVVSFEVVREVGQFGRVVVWWNVTGDFRPGEISPVTGALVFENGVMKRNISLTVHKDEVPELDEKVKIRLVGLNETGSSEPGRGALINSARALATLIIPGNDEPHGVIGWSNTLYLSQEAELTNKSISVTIRRDGGLIGPVLVSYETVEPVGALPSNEQAAVAGVDFIAKRMQVVIPDGVNSTHVTFDIIHRNYSSSNKLFYVNITAVALESGSPTSPLVTNSPRIATQTRLLEVIISQINQSLGELNLNVSESQIQATEGSTVLLEVVRTGSVVGQVGLRYTVRPRTHGSTAPASTSDYHPTDGTLYFENGETSKIINITVIDDGIPEVDEAFYVSIERPINGVKIGSKNRVDVVIKANDDPYGVFGFKGTSVPQNIVQEGKTLRLEVQRLGGSFREVHVTWSLEQSAVSQISPFNGTLSFQEGDRSKYIVLQAINDSIPEPLQQYECTLETVDNEAKINASHKTASVYIPANDKAQGIISIEPSSRHILVGEPSAGYDGVFVIRILRSVGQINEASISWKITLNASSGSSPAETFNATSGTETFKEGVKSLPVVIQVKQDRNAEEFTSYLFEITSINGAEFAGPESKKSIINVAASDDPYGVISFIPPFTYNVSEHDHFVNLTVKRKGGNVGHVVVNVTVTSPTATAGKDFQVSSYSLDFVDKDEEKQIFIRINDDSTPELAETLLVRLEHVTLRPTRPMNYSIVGGLRPDQPPRIGTNRTVKITIEKNDNANGIIQLTETTKDVRERDKQVVIALKRVGGALGKVVVHFIVHNGSATLGEDYNQSSGSVEFDEHQTTANLTIAIIDDSKPEHKETFSVELDSVSGGAELGMPRVININILTSDNPYGLVGFVNTTDLKLPNPNTSQILTFGVSRSDGTQGAVSVEWRVKRVQPVSGSLSDDFIPPTDAVLNFPDGDGSTKFFRLHLNAYTEPEPQETFLLQLSVTSGGATLDTKQANITITVLKHGFPNGIFSFQDTSTRIVSESESGTFSLTLTVQRTVGFQGEVKVYWQAIGADPEDLQSTSDVLTFPAGLASGSQTQNVVIRIKNDDVPELNETFVVMLYRVDGGGDLDPSGQNVTVTIRANDDPHGVFKLMSGAQNIVVSSSSRSLNFTVQRDRGTFGSVTVNYRVTYSSWYPGNLIGSVTVPDGQTEVNTLVPLSASAFLAIGSTFQITLTEVQYTSSGGQALGSSPRLSSPAVNQTIQVPETAANGLFSFAASSTRLTAASDNQVSSIMIVRQGLYGSVSVTWSAGYPSDSNLVGYTAGQIEPRTDTLDFSPSTRNMTFSVKAIPNASPTKKLVYAIHLQSATSSVPGGANVTGSSRVAVIEYSGVVEIAPDSRSKVVTEGEKVTCRLVRLFSIFGDIKVYYSAQGVSYTVDIPDGEYSKEFDVSSRDNNVPERDYGFYINITRVTGGHSPRLGTNTAALVNVKDNDDANGLLSFKATSIKVSENATSGNTRIVELTIQRTRGTIGAVSVIVRTVGGGEPWDKLASPKELKEELARRPKDANATVGKDYNQLEKTVNFENAFPFPAGGQSKTIQLTILEDSLPEPDEKVYLYLSNVTGGARVATSSDNLQSWAVVTIEGNDLMNGEIGFISGSQSATIDEDGSATATLKVERRGATFGTVIVVWRVREPGKRPQVEKYEDILTFEPDVIERDLVIRIRKDNIPEFKDSFHVDLVEIQNTVQARIITSASSAVITVLDSDYPYGIVGFAPQDLYKPVNLKTTEVTLEVVRSNGNTTDITVTYDTEMLPEKSTESGIATSQAVVRQDYQKPKTKTLRLKPGVTKMTISITLTPETPSDSAYPKAFRIKILNATNKAVINTQNSRAMIIISNDEDTTRFLALRATSRLSDLSDQEINKILSDLKVYVKKPLNDDRLTLTKDTIQNILNYKKNRPLMLNRKLQDISKTTFMDIFDELLTSRSDTRGRVDLAPVFEMFAFSLAYGTTCPTKDSLGLKGKYAYATAYRNPPSMLNGLQLKSMTGKHYFSYPSNLYIGVDSTQTAQCNDVHFIEYHTSHWFKGAVLNNKVLSTSLNDTSTVSQSKNPNTYLIYTSKKRVTPKGAKCVYWDFTKSEWSTAGCSVKRDKEDFVECQCNHMSNFAVQGQSDDRVGYSTYFFAACFVCMGAFALALLSHHACSVESLFSAKLLMHMFFACMAAQLMYVVGAYVSSSQAVIMEDPPVRCSVLGMFIHYFFLCQFSWMFIQGWNLWRILVLNDEHTDKKYVLFFVLGWGMPVVIIVLYIIVAQAAFSWNLHQMYGDVHSNGDMCFIPDPYAALASVVAPILLFLTGVAVVFTQAYQVTMQWRYYDDIYRGHYNIKEVRNVIILFVAVTITWLFAGLHLAYGYLWMIILFVILDVMLGLFVFILFFILRNQVRGVFKQTYAFRGEPPPIQTHDDFFRGQMGTEQSSGSSKRFKMRQSPDMPSEWDDLDNMATPSSNRKLVVNMDDTGSLDRMNETFEDEMETQDFDDLIFALKTGGNFDPDLDDEKDPQLGRGAEHFELRRISIPDTHL